MYFSDRIKKTTLKKRDCPTHSSTLPRHVPVPSHPARPSGTTAGRLQQAPYSSSPSHTGRPSTPASFVSDRAGSSLPPLPQPSRSLHTIEPRLEEEPLQGCAGSGWPRRAEGWRLPPRGHGIPWALPGSLEAQGWGWWPPNTGQMRDLAPSFLPPRPSMN